MEDFEFHASRFLGAQTEKYADYLDICCGNFVHQVAIHVDQGGLAIIVDNYQIF